MRSVVIVSVYWGLVCAVAVFRTPILWQKGGHWSQREKPKVEPHPWNYILRNRNLRWSALNRNKTSEQLQWDTVHVPLIRSHGVQRVLCHHPNITSYAANWLFLRFLTLRLWFLTPGSKIEVSLGWRISLLGTTVHIPEEGLQRTGWCPAAQSTGTEGWGTWAWILAPLFTSFATLTSYLNSWASVSCNMWITAFISGVLWRSVQWLASSIRVQ